jgi:hypothetical protein
MFSSDKQNVHISVFIITEHKSIQIYFNNRKGVSVA